MKTPALTFAALLVSANTCQAMGNDDPLLAMFELDKLETSIGESLSSTHIEAAAWAGHDLQKLYIKSESELEGGDVTSANIELLYSHAIAPFWDAQIGWRHDFRPSPKRDWFAVGLQGLAPYFFETDTTFYVSDTGDSSVNLSAEYEILFTQQLILSPEIEIVVNGYNDANTGEGSGLASIEAGLRLRYEVRRELAPYIGIKWESVFGNTADFAEDEGGHRQELTFLAGVKIWF